MPFLVVDLIIALFFLILIGYGIRTKIWPLIPVNLGAILVILTAGTLQITEKENLYSTLVIMGLLMSILGTDLGFLVKSIKATGKGGSQSEQESSSAQCQIISQESVIKNEIKREELNDDGHYAFQMWKLGNQAFLENNYPEAIENYELSIRWLPTSVAYFNLSCVLLKLNDNANAFVNCDKAIELQPDFYEAWINRGIVLERLKRYEEALKCFKKAGEIKSDRPEVWLFTGNLLQKISQFQEAISYYNKATEFKSNYLEAWYNKGLCFTKLNCHEEAFRCFDEVTKINSDYYLGHYQRANALNRTDRNEEAVAGYDKALKIKSDYTEAWNNRGIALSKLGRLRDAIRSYEKALESNPSYYEAWINYGLSLDSSGMYEKAIESYQRIIKLAPSEMQKHISITKKRIEELQQKLNL